MIMKSPSISKCMYCIHKTSTRSPSRIACSRSPLGCPTSQPPTCLFFDFNSPLIVPSATILHCCCRSLRENGRQRASLAGLVYSLDLAHPLEHRLSHVLASRSPHVPFRRPAGLELLRPRKITLQMKGLFLFGEEMRLNRSR